MAWAGWVKKRFYRVCRDIWGCVVVLVGIRQGSRVM